ncbi:hypothetical protein PVAND_015794 [Polypedilum vanderplanki]|uniref:Uncharacterized protein n=1 Tax=Polypedilum vanderplanki TaxID=319348 RepID=A0A9J6BD67_POLVA|nr:hypothetical protein PVAND_015794 [Polypedilum vanderplanki]
MKVKILFLLILVSKKLKVTAITIECLYGSTHWWQSDETYKECKVKNVMIFDGSQVNIEDVQDSNHSNWDNNQINAIHIETAPNMYYFPSGMKTVFKNLIQIAITGSKLVKIKNKDLEVFPELKNLYLNSNAIEFIVGPLFKFNLELEIIDLSYNKISLYDYRTFEQLPKLRFLDLRENICKYLSFEITREKVIEMVQNMEKNYCQIAPNNFNDEYY